MSLIEATCGEIDKAILCLQEGDYGSTFDQHLSFAQTYLRELIESIRVDLAYLPFAEKEDKRNVYFVLGLLHDALMFTSPSVLTPKNLEGYNKLLDRVTDEILLGGTDDNPMPFMEYRKMLVELGMNVVP